MTGNSSVAIFCHGKMKNNKANKAQQSNGKNEKQQNSETKDGLPAELYKAVAEEETCIEIMTECMNHVISNGKIPE